jgi:hypothetical protein
MLAHSYLYISLFYRIIDIELDNTYENGIKSIQIYRMTIQVIDI